MKIQIESYGNKYTVETDRDDHNVHEMIDFISDLLVCAGFSHEGVENGFILKAEEIKEDNNE